MELMDRDCDERPPMKQWDVGILPLLVRRLVGRGTFYLYVKKLTHSVVKTKMKRMEHLYLYIFYTHILQVCIFPIRRTVL